MPLMNTMNIYNGNKIISKIITYIKIIRAIVNLIKIMAMEIYKYTYDTDEWKNIRSSKLEWEERENAFNEYIKTYGTKVTVQEYFKDSWRKSKINQQKLSYMTNVEDILLSMKLHIPKMITRLVLSKIFAKS